MQNRSSPLLRSFSPVHLPSKFPIVSSAWDHPDTPIRELHAHDFLELGYCHSGSGIFVVEEKIFQFHSGCGMIIAPRAFHRARSTPGTISSWSFMQMDLARLLAAPGLDPRLLDLNQLGGSNFENILKPAQHEFLCALLKELSVEIENKPKGYQSSVRGLLTTTMAHIHRLPGRSKEPFEYRGDALSRVSSALSIMAEDLTVEYPIPELAKRCHLSEAQFRRVFQKALRQSPKTYQLNVRIHTAATLLHNSGATILEISHSCGFNSLSSFNRQFKKTFGQPPRAWRKKRSEV